MESNVDEIFAITDLLREKLSFKLNDTEMENLIEEVTHTIQVQNDLDNIKKSIFYITKKCQDIERCLDSINRQSRNISRVNHRIFRHRSPALSNQSFNVLSQDTKPCNYKFVSNPPT
jgi:hypothetical protein